jgi:outer membrane protein assembly factor BamB
MFKHTVCFTISLTIAICSLAAEPLPERHWPRWRGPNNGGSVAQGKFLTSWNEKQGIAWKIELPGPGCSTPIVWDNQIILTCGVADQDTVVAFDWTGKKLWQTAVGKQRAGKHRNGSGSNPSCVTDGKYIFAYFKSGQVAGLDIQGKLLWKTNLQERFAKDTLYWDLGTSPVLTKNNVNVAVMHKGNSYLAAFDKKSGQLQWKVDRNYQTPVEGDHSYATPIVMEQSGKEAILVWGAEHLTAHSAEDGSQLWSCAGFNPEEKRNWVAVASYVIAGDVAVIPYGRGSRLAGIRLGGKGDVSKTHRLWTRTDTGSFVPTPCTDGKQVFLLRDSGEVQGIDPQTGKTLWEGRFPKHRAKYYASPVVAGGNVYAPREDGVLLVASLKNGFQVEAENDMGERLIASPVPIGNHLLIRGERHLWCIGE